MSYDVARVAALLTITAAAAICDLATGKLPNRLTYPAVLLGLGLAAGFTGWPGIVEALAGLAVGFLPMFVAFVVGGYGGGDAKLMAAVGALALPDLTLRTLIYALLIGAAMALITIIWQGRTRQTMRRFGHALGLILLGRKPSDPAPPDAPRVPLGAAIWLGTCWSLLEWRFSTTAWDALARQF
ncbi:MAG: prepilin peptidase [Xanthomonadales bacterium]|nr:prepilin peptidase [Xanthomonadales bacterium]